MSYETFNQFTFWLYLVLAFALFYQSWMNIVKRQLTKFSLDALVLLYIRVLKGNNVLAKSKKLLTNEPNRLRMLGLFAVCGGITAIYLAIDTYIKYLH